MVIGVEKYLQCLILNDNEQIFICVIFILYLTKEDYANNYL
jgi:hypothetical protein